MYGGVSLLLIYASSVACLNVVAIFVILIDKCQFL